MNKLAKQVFALVKKGKVYDDDVESRLKQKMLEEKPKYIAKKSAKFDL